MLNSLYIHDFKQDSRGERERERGRGREREFVEYINTKTDCVI